MENFKNSALSLNSKLFLLSAFASFGSLIIAFRGLIPIVIIIPLVIICGLITFSSGIIVNSLIEKIKTPEKQKMIMYGIVALYPLCFILIGIVFLLLTGTISFVQCNPQ